MDIQIFSDCVCSNFKDCEEKGKIIWNGKLGDFTHIRYDNCVCTSNDVQKSDCIIIFDDRSPSKLIIFVIETKEGNPSFSEAQSQIQTCLNHLSVILMRYQNHINIVPIIYADKFPRNIRRTLLSYKLRCFGKPYTMRHIVNGNELVSNAVRRR